MDVENSKDKKIKWVSVCFGFKKKLNELALKS